MPVGSLAAAYDMGAQYIDRAFPMPKVHKKISDLVIKVNLAKNQNWLQMGAHISNYNPQRNDMGIPLGHGKRKSMARFLFIADVFTSLDGVALPDGRIKILCNKHFMRRYYEDNAFTRAEFRRGRIVTTSQLWQAVKRYVKFSNRRAKEHLRPDGTKMYPKKRKV